jgi:MFS family permease
MGKTTFELAGREFPAISWYRDAKLRKLYVCLLLVVLTSATNGYDGSMLNGLQALTYFKSYFNNPDGGTLGLMVSMMAIGSICAIPFVPYAADILGRRTGILIGCIIM